MTRRSWITLAVILAVTAAAGLWWFLVGAVTPANRLALAGNVNSDVRTVQAPAIVYPTPNYAVGIPASQTAGAQKPSAGSSMRSQSPTISGLIESVHVRQGDRVEAGQAVVQLDTKALQLGVAQAKTAQKRARAQVGVLGGTLTTVQDNQSKLATAKNQLATAAAGLAKGAAALKKAEAQFAGQKAAALKKRAELVQLRAVLAAQLAALEHSPSPDPTAIAKLRGQIAGIDQAIAGIDKGLAAAAAGFAQGNAKIATGSAKLATARGQLATGASALSKAKRQLENARNVSRLSLAIQDAGVTLAEVRLSQATILAPVTGTVTEARTAGTVAMVGAPLVRIRPDGPTKITTYLTGEQLATVPLGTPAEVTYDSNAGSPLAGKVTRVGLQSEFPPTSFPTNIVHMTQAVRVEVTLDGTGWAPPGTPVDLVLRTTAGR